MRKSIFLSLLIAAGVGYLSCKDAAPSKRADTPEEVHSVKYVQNSNDWYKNQIALWKKEIDKNPSDARAWYNYYKANRYFRFENMHTDERQNLLKSIVADMGKNVPGSYEYCYLRASHTSHDEQAERYEWAMKAYQIDSSRPEALYLLADYFDLKNDLKKRREFYLELYESEDLAPGLLEYSYNVLMALEANGILITHGDNDTYPVLLLQDVFGIREDITLINVSQMKHLKGYLENRLQQKDIKVDFSSLPERGKDGFLEGFVRYLHADHSDIPLYFALTVYDTLLTPFEGQLHIVGLAYRFDTDEFDNLAIIKKNLEQRLRLDYLSHDWYDETYKGTGLIPDMNMNYVVPMLMLAQHYKQSGEFTRAERWKERALVIGDESGNLQVIENWVRERNL